MRQWFRTLALGAMVAMVVAAPAAAQDGDFDDAPSGTNQQVAAQVMEQGQYRLGAPDLVAPATVGDEVGDQDRVRDRDRDGSGECIAADAVRDQTRDRSRVGDGTGECCDGDRAVEMEQIRNRIREARDGCEAGWMFAHCHAWAHQVAL